MKKLEIFRQPVLCPAGGPSTEKPNVTLMAMWKDGGYGNWSNSTARWKDSGGWSNSTARWKDGGAGRWSNSTASWKDYGGWSNSTARWKDSGGWSNSSSSGK